MSDSTAAPGPASNDDVESVERVIAAPAAAIFAVLADPSRHQEIDGSGTVREAAGGSQQVTLGSKFGMSMKMGIPYSMENEIIEFEQDRRIAWQTRPSIKFMRRFVGGRIWRYELEPVEGGTLVRESWDISQEKVKKGVQSMRGRTREAMTKTLERIEQVVTGAA
jgi:uncharacterized protein YndB with AHSA1/START domain